MKPCLHRRKAIALLVLGEVKGHEAEELRIHLQSCEGCRGYLQEISAVTIKLAALETTSDVEASQAFHRRVMSSLPGHESKLSWGIARVFGLNWRVALPIAATAGCAVLLLWMRVQMRESNVVTNRIMPGAAHTVAASDANSEVPPTLGNYQMAADQSLQKFDALLNREAKPTISGGPVYTVSELTIADGGM